MSDVVGKLWGFCHTLRHDGIDYGDYIEQLKDEYYEQHGWDKATSLPTRKKLEELDMADVAEVLAKENALI